MKITCERSLTVILGLRSCRTVKYYGCIIHFLNPYSPESIPVLCLCLIFLHATGLKDIIWLRPKLWENVCDKWFGQLQGPLYSSEIFTAQFEWKRRAFPLKWHQTQYYKTLKNVLNTPPLLLNHNRFLHPHLPAETWTISDTKPVNPSLNPSLSYTHAHAHKHSHHCGKLLMDFFTDSSETWNEPFDILFQWRMCYGSVNVNEFRFDHFCSITLVGITLMIWMLFFIITWIWSEMKYHFLWHWIVFLTVAVLEVCVWCPVYKKKKNQGFQ